MNISHSIFNKRFFFLILTYINESGLLPIIIIDNLFFIVNPLSFFLSYYKYFRLSV